MARSLVLDQSGQPILVEFNDDGSEGQPVSIPSDYQTRMRELRIYSAADYRTEVARYLRRIMKYRFFVYFMMRSTGRLPHPKSNVDC